MALLTARDVFVRRPACVRLWVVPAERIVARTAESLADRPPAMSGPGGPSDQPFAVFVKRDHRDQHAYAGEVQAADSEAAMAEAWQRHRENEPAALWVAPMSDVLQSAEADVESWFGPADDKPYRHGTFYHTQSLMREIRSGGEQAGADGDAT
jgi:ring-1,2-phenylacetyl-CoA epoxidase subunit PaaB